MKLWCVAPLVVTLLWLDPIKGPMLEKRTVSNICTGDCMTKLPDFSDDFHFYDEEAGQVIVICRKKDDGSVEKCSVHPDYQEEWRP